MIKNDDLENIYLLKRQYKILKKLKPNVFYKIDYSNDIQTLLNNGLIIGKEIGIIKGVTQYSKEYFKITLKGEMYIEKTKSEKREQFKNNSRQNISLTISIISFLLSVPSIIMSIIALFG